MGRWGWMATTVSNATRVSLNALVIAVLVVGFLCFTLSCLVVYTVFLEQEHAYARKVTDVSQQAYEEGVSAGCAAFLPSITTHEESALWSRMLNWKKESQQGHQILNLHVSKDIKGTVTR